MNLFTIMENDALYIIKTIEKSGFEAFAVGGCVRDILLGIEPKDWDICTSALPNQILEIFSAHKILLTGEKYGTVTLLLNNTPYEITTYRIESEYSNNRQPDKVEFVSDLKTDLSRRDFTINALAYHPEKGIIDYFSSEKDIKNRQIKCVGNAEKRFNEDALRILRALRFAAVFNFDIEDETANALFKYKKLLKNISVERIAIEMNKLLLGDNAGNIIKEFFPIFEEFFPELSPIKNFEQNNKYHCYDVLVHTCQSIDHAPKDIYVRLAMLFHDCGKPETYTETGGIGHFYGHAKVSQIIAISCLSRLKYDKKTIKIVAGLVLKHNDDIQPTKKSIKKWLNKIGEKEFRQLLEVVKADNLAKSMYAKEKKMPAFQQIEPLLNEIINQKQCFSLKDLAINGQDLIGLGFSESKRIGEILNTLLEMVLNDEIENNKIILLNVASAFLPSFVKGGSRDI